MTTVNYEREMLVEQRLTKEMKSTGLAYVFWFFFGGMGGHRLYLGRFVSGIIMMVMYIVGIVGSMSGDFIGMLVMVALVVWVIADLFCIPSMNRSNTKATRDRIQGEIA